jgi:peptidoglycan/LPS O-acetylase OafA/YrhL
MVPMSDEGDLPGTAVAEPRAPVVGPAGTAVADVADPSRATGTGTAPVPDKPFSLGNRPALTGIRAVGVTLVLIFHSNFKTLPGSWVALGVFFVLSGFLITTMLATEHQKTGSISLGKFYSRRGVRLLPPLLLAVALLGIYAAIVPVANAGNRIWGDSAAAVFYVSDYRSAFGHEPFLGFMAQCWSLAVEEQYYLIWAAAFVVALKYGSRRVAYLLVGVGIVGCVANRVHIVLAASHWNSYVAGRVYYAFDTRADALFLGCLLGLLATGGHLDRWPRWAQRGLSTAALASTAIMIYIIMTVGLASRALPLWWLPISEVASALIIVYFVVRPEGWGTRAMGLGFLVLLGNMSYTIYIIHWPIYVAISPFTVKWSYAVTETVRLAIILPLAAASWFLMERPLTRWRRKALDPAQARPAVGDPTSDDAATR